MVPRVGQIPAENLTIIISVDLILINVEVAVLIVFPQLLDIKVDLVIKHVPVDHSRFRAVIAVWIHSNAYFRDFRAVLSDLSLNIRLISNVLSINLAANSINLGNLRNHFLQPSIDLSELLHALFLVKFVFHHAVKLHFRALLLISQIPLLSLHLFFPLDPVFLLCLPHLICSPFVLLGSLLCHPRLHFLKLTFFIFLFLSDFLLHFLEFGGEILTFLKHGN